MDTWLLAVDCVINLGILGWLVFEYRHPAPTKVLKLDMRWVPSAVDPTIYSLVTRQFVPSKQDDPPA